MNNIFEALHQEITSSNAIQLETLINQELLKVKELCDINRLSINFKKTNYMNRVSV